MLRSLVNLTRESPASASVRFNSILSQFFDNKDTFGKAELRPRQRPGRPWSADELRLKSNTDLHKLWYVCLKERNMLLTMQKAHLAHARNMPNPERIDRVKETMDNIEEVVNERNDAFFKLETGESASPPERTVTSFTGFTYKKQAKEHFLPASEGEKEYEVPYLDDDAYQMQKLWHEKEYLKARDRKEDETRRVAMSEDKIRFRRGLPRVFNK